MLIWAKTEAGRMEIQARALVKERAQRNLLLVIDGRKTDEMLLEHLAGISGDDFRSLEALGLIALVGGRPGASPAPSPSPRVMAAPITGAASAPQRPPAAVPVGDRGVPASPAPTVPLDYPQFTAALTRLISSELGLRGFMLTLAVEKAGTAQELVAVAERAIAQIRERRGEASAAAASRTLFGG